MSLAVGGYLAAMTAGLLGSAHCIGMCGGIVNGFNASLKQQSQHSIVAMNSFFHLGRLLSYLTIACLFALFGMALRDMFLGSAFGMLPRLFLALGIALVGVSMLGFPVMYPLQKLFKPVGVWASRNRIRFLPMDHPFKALAGGYLWGLMPCGLSYGAITLAFSAPSIWESLGFICIFWASTLPALVTGSSLIVALRKRWGHDAVTKWSAVWMFSLALWTAWPALNMMAGGGHDMSAHQHGQSNINESESATKNEEAVHHHHNSHGDESSHSVVPNVKK